MFLSINFCNSSSSSILFYSFLYYFSISISFILSGLRPILLFFIFLTPFYLIIIFIPYFYLFLSFFFKSTPYSLNFYISFLSFNTLIYNDLFYTLFIFYYLLFYPYPALFSSYFYILKKLDSSLGISFSNSGDSE